MKRILIGAIAGAAATIPMSWAMEIMHRALPRHEQQPLPPREIIERVVDGLGIEHQIEKEYRPWLALAAHLGYGAAVGSIYATLTTRDSSKALSKGIAYGLGVWAVSYFGLLPAINILRPAHRHPVRRSALMVLAHVVFGSALGLFTDLFGHEDQSKGLQFLGGEGSDVTQPGEVAT